MAGHILTFHPPSSELLTLVLGPPRSFPILPIVDEASPSLPGAMRRGPFESSALGPLGPKTMGSRGSSGGDPALEAERPATAVQPEGDRLRPGLPPPAVAPLLALKPREELLRQGSTASPPPTVPPPPPPCLLSLLEPRAVVERLPPIGDHPVCSTLPR